MAISGPSGANIEDGARQRDRMGGKLSLLSRYLLGQLAGPVAMLALLLTCVILLTQSLRLLDLVINRGQSAPTFLYLISLVIPGLLVIILPIAFFVGTLVTLTRLNGDSELVVMSSAGYSLRQLAGPVFIAAGIVMVLTWICALWLAPAGQRALSAKEVDIRADVAGALLNEGQFNPAAQGVTVFIRQLDSDGQFHGILVHDSRDPKQAITYIAQRGALAQTNAGARLMMFDGTVERYAGAAKLSILSFGSYVVSMDQFAGATRPTTRKANELYLGELLQPADKGITPKDRAAYLKEANDRLSQPLYCLAFAMICLAAILRGRRQRGALAMRLTGASLAAAALRIAGYGLAGPAASHPMLDIFLYVIPLLGAGLAWLVLMGYSPRALMARHALQVPA
jgi:lipopolysaccharide export system permease protein